MEHLSQEELLLLADGELADERAAHLDACSECCAAAGAMQGQLTAITAQLRAAAPADNPESHSASWSRLEAAIRGEADVLSTHLLAEELLMHMDDELAPERALHLESCEDCHDELLRVQALLFDVEHELRALIPAESPERRLAAVAALERKLYPPKKVISFPVRWGAVYAAAAALTLAVFGGLWTAQKPAPIETPVQIAAVRSAPASTAATQPAIPAVIASSSRELAESGASAGRTAQAEPPVQLSEPERYELGETKAMPLPQRSALPVTAASLTIEPEPASGVSLAWAAPAVPSVRVAPATPELTPVADPEALVAGMSAAVRAGAWSQNIVAEMRGGLLTFAGSASSPEDRAELIAAVRRELSGREARFDIAVSNRASSATAGAPYTLGDRPAGGMMRTALLAHYSDAARRSFQQPTLSALESEIARFASEIYRSQSKLVRHAHALSTLLQDVQPEDLSPEASKALESLVRFHANGVSESEAQIYDHLSEALPRRYWNHRGDRQELADAEAAAAGHALLADALRLDETLTTLLGSSAGSVDVGEVETSAGALLYRIRMRARNLTSGLDSGR